MGVNRFFIIEKTGDLNELKALELCIGQLDTQRYSTDCSHILIMTRKVNSKTKHLLGKEYSSDEIKKIMQTPEWTKKEDDVSI